MKKIILTVLSICALTAIASAAVDYKPDSNAPRSAVPNAYKWDTGAVFANDGDWEKAYTAVKKNLDGLQVFKGTLSKAETIKDCLDDYMAVSKMFSRTSLYSTLKVTEDENVEKYQKMKQRSVALANEYNAKTSFIREELMKMDNKTLDSILASPLLDKYREYLKDLLRRKGHILPTEAERVLSLASDNLWAEIDTSELPSDIEMVFKAVLRDIPLPKIKDESGKEVQLTLANYGKYRASKDREVRKAAVAGLFGALRKYQNIFAATLGGEFKRDVFLARARKYNSAIGAYLDRENVDPKVVDNLINTINKNLKPLHRYVDLRKKMLKLPDIHIYDLYTPIVPGISKEYTYNDAAKDIPEALKPLGKEYIGVLSKSILPESGWTDIYPNKGKESGAFCTAIWGLHPFVKMNYMNEIDDASTLAHEFGHAMHSYLNNAAQPYEMAGYSTLAAEIASTLNETLFINYLLNKFKDDDQTRLYLLGEQLEGIRTTIYRQTMFAEFEKKLHELAEAGEPVTAELYNKTYKGLVQKYYGPGFTIDENDEIEWAYIPHFYWKFYVYSYAAGLSSGIAMSEKIMAGGEKGSEQYLAFLKSPAIVPPVEAIKKGGVDLTAPGAIEAAAKKMSLVIDEMERILAKGKQ
jgi:oligoendopeptidase F